MATDQPWRVRLGSGASGVGCVRHLHLSFGSLPQPLGQSAILCGTARAELSRGYNARVSQIEALPYFRRRGGVKRIMLGRRKWIARHFMPGMLGGMKERVPEELMEN